MSEEETNNLARSSRRIGECVGAAILYERGSDRDSALHGIRCYVNKNSDNSVSIDDCKDASLANRTYKTLCTIERQFVLTQTEDENLKKTCRAEYVAALEDLLKQDIQD